MDGKHFIRATLLPVSNLHLHFPEPDDSRPRVCVVCRRDEADMLCERCKMPMHGSCQFGAAGIATPGERNMFALLAVTQNPQIAPVIFLCNGCRS